MQGMQLVMLVFTHLLNLCKFLHKNRDVISEVEFTKLSHEESLTENNIENRSFCHF